MKDKIRKFFIFICSIPKTIFFNFRYLPFKQAVKLPFWIRVGFKCNVKGKLVLKNSELSMFLIKIGVDGSQHISANKDSKFVVAKAGKVIFNGKASFGVGSSVRVDRGVLNFGDNFSCNKNCNISCSYNIKFGNDNLLGWNVFVGDTDGHQIFHKGILKESSKPVITGNHVWLCSFSDILKGAIIGDNSIVAWRACVLKSFSENNVLIGGFPAKILQNDIEWKH